MRKGTLLAGSHLACLLAGGYFLNAATGPQGPPDGGMAATKSGERAGRDPLGSQGKELVIRALTASKAPGYEAAEAEIAAGRFSNKGDGEKRVRELAAAGAGPSAEFAGALLAWFRDDPKAAFDFMQTAGAGGIHDAVLVQALKEMSPEDHLTFAESLADSPAIFASGRFSA
jgi:hypothetical protein